MVFNDITNADVPTESEEEATAWTGALLPLVKGKTTMDKAGMARTSDALGKVERASDRGIINLGMLKVRLLTHLAFSTPLLTLSRAGERVGGHRAEAR